MGNSVCLTTPSILLGSIPGVVFLIGYLTMLASQPVRQPIRPRTSRTPTAQAVTERSADITIGEIISACRDVPPDKRQRGIVGIGDLFGIAAGKIVAGVRDRDQPMLDSGPR
jgi:hypothetical protein